LKIIVGGGGEIVKKWKRQNRPDFLFYFFQKLSDNGSIIESTPLTCHLESCEKQGELQFIKYLLEKVVSILRFNKIYVIISRAR